MGKFCSNCGKAVKEDQDVCLGCGKVINEAPNSAPVATNSVSVVTNKIRFNGYYISTGIIAIVLSALVLLAGIGYAYSQSVSLYSSLYSSVEPVSTFIIPGLIGIAGGIFCLCGRRSMGLMITSGILYIVSTLINTIAIANISLLGLCLGTFGVLNIVFGAKIKKTV